MRNLPHAPRSLVELHGRGERRGSLSGGQPAVGLDEGGAAMLAPLFLIVLLAFMGVLWAFRDDD